MAWRKPSNIQGWLKLGLRHWKKAVFPALFVMIVAAVASFWWPRSYKAEAKFQRRMDLTVMEAGTSTIDRNLQPIRRALQEDLRGRKSIDQLIDDLIASDAHVSKQWQFPHAPDGALTKEGQFKKQDLIRDIQKRLNVSYQVRSNEIDQIVVAYTDPDRVLAPKVTNRLIENYIKNTRDQLNGMLLKAQRFFKSEVDRYTTQTRELERKKLRMELDHPGLADDDPSGVRAKLENLQRKRDRLDEELLVLKHKLQALLTFVKNQPEMIPRTTTIENPERKKLIDRRDNLAESLDFSINELKRRETHPDVINLRRRIAEINERLAKMDVEIAGDAVLEPNLQRLEAEQKVRELAAEVTAKESQRQDTSNMVEQLEIQDRNFFPVRKEYVDISTKLKDADRQLKFWRDNLRKTTVALTAEVGYRGVHLDFIQHAPELERPSKPTLLIITAIACAAGVVCALGIIALAELMDRSFRSVEQAVDDLKLPVLGAVNEIVTPGRALRRKVIGWGVIPALMVGMLIILGAAFLSVYISLDQPYKFDQFKRNPVSFIEKTYLG